MRPLINFPTVIAIVACATTAHADPTSGVDSALFRSSYDTNGVFAVEGARLMPKHDLSFKILVGYERSPLNVAIPGIGGVGDTGKDKVLDYLTTIDMAFGMSISDAVAIGIDVAAYRTATGGGYGVRGLFTDPTKKSTGLISLRPLSNIDPSADPNDSTAYLGDGLAGPLDARFGLKYALFANHRVAVTAVGSVFLPFGNDEMLLGDRNLVFEPKLAFEFRPDRIHATRIVANVAARIRERAVLEAYDPADPMSMPKAFLDIGSEAVVGVGAVLELSPRAFVAAEAQAFVPLPDALDWGPCRLNDGEPCSQITYFGDAKHGDLTTLATAGLMIRVTPDVTASVMAGTGQLGARSDTFSVTTGITWSPQPGGTATHGFGDRDGDGIPDNVDQCPDEREDFDGYQDADGCPDPDNDGDGIPDAQDKCPNDPEDKDGFQDADGCPELDNDGDGIPDSLDKCPNDPEDFDGFQDADGCPDDDNDGDGIPDKLDKCPNDPENFNGFEDEDGCPDSRPGNGPEERPDRIDLKGAQVAFTRGGAALTAQAKSLLNQVAAIIKVRKLTIRVEVHIALGVKSTNAAVITAQKRRDKVLAQQRAQAIQQYLVSQGVPIAQVQAVGIGSDRPLGASNPTDPVNERVDLIKAQQGAAP
ncbi:MAG TPA: OmpA family protein [Kofleriaceae bacterium]|nr:OmpA family protein [Kofleriaceae bacterium]